MPKGLTRQVKKEGVKPYNVKKGFVDKDNADLFDIMLKERRYIHDGVDEDLLKRELGKDKSKWILEMGTWLKSNLRGVQKYRERLKVQEKLYEELDEDNYPEEEVLCGHSDGLCTTKWRIKQCEAIERFIEDWKSRRNSATTHTLPNDK